MNASIHLTRFDASSDDLPDAIRHAWPLTILATGTSIPSEIFVYHAAQSGPEGYDSFRGDRFEVIASVPQLDEIPKEQPTHGEDGRLIPYYRRSKLELVCRSPEEANRVWQDVQKEVSKLVLNFNATFNLESMESVSISDDQIEDTTNVNGTITFKGTVPGGSVPNTSTAPGNYYIISISGSSQGIAWIAGDYAVYRGNGIWDQIPSGNSSHEVSGVGPPENVQVGAYRSQTYTDTITTASYRFLGTPGTKIGWV